MHGAARSVLRLLAASVAAFTAGHAYQAPPPGGERLGTVKYRIPPGWQVSSRSDDEVTLIPRTLMEIRERSPLDALDTFDLNITLYRGVYATPGFRAAFEARLAQVLPEPYRESRRSIESFAAPDGHEILRAIVPGYRRPQRIGGREFGGKRVVYTAVAANPFGRLEVVALAMPDDEQSKNTYWPVFEKFRQSLEYLPEAEAARAPEIPAVESGIWAKYSPPPSPGPPAKPSAPPAAQPPAGLQIAQPPGNGIGARYGARDPRVCKSTKEPLSGPISAEQAERYVICLHEREFSPKLYLLSARERQN